MTTPEPVVQIHDGAVELGGRPILRGIDLAVRPGEVVAVLGANGSGKSTLVRALMGLAPLTRGEVRLFGTALSGFRAWKRVGYVPQRITAAAGVPASVGEVVVSGRLSRRHLFTPMRRGDREAVREALAAVDLADRFDDGVSTLSGGQQQRVLIARALAGQPDLLVMDEPMAGVDMLSQEAFASCVGRLRDQGRTVLLVAHELGPLQPLIDRTVVMHDGRVAYDGVPLAAFHEAGHHGHHPDHASRREPDHRPQVVSPLDQAVEDGGHR